MANLDAIAAYLRGSRTQSPLNVAMLERSLKTSGRMIRPQDAVSTSMYGSIPDVGQFNTSGSLPTNPGPIDPPILTGDYPAPPIPVGPTRSDIWTRMDPGMGYINPSLTINPGDDSGSIYEEPSPESQSAHPTRSGSGRSHTTGGVTVTAPPVPSFGPLLNAYPNINNPAAVRALEHGANPSDVLGHAQFDSRAAGALEMWSQAMHQPVNRPGNATTDAGRVNFAPLINAAGTTTGRLSDAGFTQAQHAGPRIAWNTPGQGAGTSFNANTYNNWLAKNNPQGNAALAAWRAKQAQYAPPLQITSGG